MTRNKRMISTEILETDIFSDLPATAKLLYIYFILHSDDDGFVAKPKSIMRSINSNEDDFRVLDAKKFIISFPEGSVCVIKHWRVHNQLRKDIYQETKYLKFKEKLSIKKSGVYTINKEESIPIPKGYFSIESLNKDYVNVTSPSRKRNVALSKGKESKVNKRKDNRYMDFEKSIHTQWNSFCDNNPTVPKIKEITNNRRKKIKLRYQEPSFKDFNAILTCINKQPFLMGDNDRRWKATFDWIIENDTNYMKILEEKYLDDKPKFNQYTHGLK